MPVTHHVLSTSNTAPRGTRSPTSLTAYSPTRERMPTPTFSRPPTTDVKTTPIFSNSSTKTPTTSSPPTYIPSTPPRRITHHRTSPASHVSPTLQRALNTSLPQSPSETLHYSSPPSSFPTHFSDDVELSPITPRRTPPSISIHSESPFDDRHSIVLPPRMDRKRIVLSDEDPFEWQDAVVGGKQKTMPGYKFASLSPRTLDEKGETMTFGPMLNEVRPVSEIRRSLCPANLPSIPASTLKDHPDLASPLPPHKSASTSRNRPRQLDPIKPSFRRLFALSTPRDLLVLLFPAVAIAIASGLVPPYMSLVIGDAFAIFAAYPTSTSTADETQRSALKSGIVTTSLKLTVAGALAVLFNYLKGVTWVRYGETMADHLREKVYNGVQAKGMEWFDMGMGMKLDEKVDGSEAVGAGGLMAKFTRETDDVRIALSMPSGLVVQNVAIFILCFILAMVKSPVLTLVTLSTIPLVVLTQFVTQVLCAPLYSDERRAFAEASTSIERATSAIATVKVHNAQHTEENRFLRLIIKGRGSLIRQGLVWAIATGMTDFLLLGTFVIGFWYGAKIVRDGKATSGAVMTCFWACLFSATYLQQIVPQLMTMTKGKNSLASLFTVIQDDADRPLLGTPLSPASSTPSFPVAASNESSTGNITKRKSQPSSLRGIRPTRCHGEFDFRSVSFAYPSRPENLVLRDVSLFIPPGETTFIVGGSGSGKSTIAQLLLRLYNPTNGEIALDDQTFSFLDPAYTREHIAAVQQGCILFDMSVHDNVAMGLAGAGATRDPFSDQVIQRTVKDVTREEVIQACRMAMIDDFIESLPQGYDTVLGTGGSSLSGGQRQRMAIARARIRDPTVLILDEATSALDPTSRILVFQSIKSWRKNRTTIVITHDLSQVVPDDFVYVMKDGWIAEQGFRVDLMDKAGGVFAMMAAEQAVDPLPPKVVDEVDSHDADWRAGLDEILDMEKEFEEVLEDRASWRPHTPSFAAGLRPGSAMYMDMLEEYSRGHRLSHVQKRNSTNTQILSTAQRRLSWAPEDLGSRAPSRIRLNEMYHRAPSGLSRLSFENPPQLGSRQISFDTSRPSRLSLDMPHTRADTKSLTSEGGMLHHSWSTETKSQPNILRQQRTMGEELDNDLGPSENDGSVPALSSATAIPGLLSLIRLYFPTLPAKYLLLLGSIGSVGHGITTPVWAFFLAKLMNIVGAGGTDTSSLTKFGLIVLALCAAQGLADSTREYSLVALSARWSYQLRKEAYHKVMNQDKAFFDGSANSPSRLVQTLIKDADDARTLMSHVIGKAVTVITMVGLGIVWAMIVGWRLTLTGVALGPVFACLFAPSSWLVSKTEVGSKARREAVGRTFYESVANIRGIRAMALDPAFRDRFNADRATAKRVGMATGWVIGLAPALTGGVPLFAQALMNFAGAQFMLENRMNYEQMLQVYNLVLFSLTFGASMLDFIPTLAKARDAARDFNRLWLLSTTTTESQGALRFPISGHVRFSHISFAYPSRPDVPVLDDLSFTLFPGECIGIVGSSGSGKSTIAALLQRLYLPTSGKVLFDDNDWFDLVQADVLWLRNHIAVVSQSANLFDATIAENIAYGTGPSPSLGSEIFDDISTDGRVGGIPLSEIHRAAKLANIHDFIQALPLGYDTPLGENASLISGGQAQRLQIARALVRRSNILILDECTSALDIDNQRAILDTIDKIKVSRTTIFITHSIDAMKRCDRLIVLSEGRAVEEGSYHELINKGGAFAKLMGSGEWE